jgi:cation:H+ antiporter
MVFSFQKEKNMSYLWLIIGFISLIKGADLFVSGSSNLARYFRIPPIIIGLTIVAFGTSSPEAAVSISAALNGTSGISIGNIIGSNIMNITLIIGIIAMISPLKVSRKNIIKEIPFSLLGGFVLLILISDVIFHNSSSNMLSRSDGLIFLAFFSIFLYYIIEVALKSKNEPANLDSSYLTQSNHQQINISKSVILFIIGLTGIVLGGWLVVENAEKIALNLGMSETLVGLSIVAIGTSLPELITSIVAAIKKESEIALGNIIGSNIFNIFFVLGISSTIQPLEILHPISFDLILMILITLILLIFSTTHHRKVNRTEGLMLSLIYISYFIFIIIRN